jgi:hypothetical protein
MNEPEHRTKVQEHVVSGNTLRPEPPLHNIIST